MAWQRAKGLQRLSSTRLDVGRLRKQGAIFIAPAELKSESNRDPVLELEELLFSNAFD
jgi:hypothetical protein